MTIKFKPFHKICLFKIKPSKSFSIKKAANTIALESSVGTWTDVKQMDYVKKLKAKVFSKNQTSNPNDIVSLQGAAAKRAGFGIGHGLDYEVIK